MTSINLIETSVDQNRAREVLNAWAEKKNLAPLTFNKEGFVYYPYYCGETTTSIRRIPPLPPRKIPHRWLLDAITGRPFMLPETLEGTPQEVNESENILDPVIDSQGADENIREHLPRFIMRHYKFFFTPTIETKNFSLLYIKVWLFNFTDKNGDETYLGVNTWSGNIMELED